MPRSHSKKLETAGFQPSPFSVEVSALLFQVHLQIQCPPTHNRHSTKVWVGRHALTIQQGELRVCKASKMSPACHPQPPGEKGARSFVVVSILPQLVSAHPQPRLLRLPSVITLFLFDTQTRPGLWEWGRGTATPLARGLHLE